jgi:hypothetical protein
MGLLTVAPVRLVFAENFGLPPTHFEILNQAGTQVIGHGRYEVVSSGDHLATALGENHFNDGTYDIERDRLVVDGPGKAPRMLTYDHAYYAANGSVERESKANFTTGEVACIRYDNGKADVTSATFELPPDTYSGSLIIVPIRDSMMRGESGPIILHDVNCAPGPKLFKIKARATKRSTWKFYPGELTQIEIEPDLGWLNLVLAPFVPHIKAWFNPANNWTFVGGNFQLYYKGPKVILARVPADYPVKGAAVATAGVNAEKKGRKD